ncbi:aldo/keto reductase [Oscillatoria laete-virens NRMC-F 0139]|nr:aldo/keto reductase [Oscillatoria laete-virens]MDL5055243.1 aldo/keto reductase [Oscillatoria laete-virens NRMC-F 0139]
MEYRNLGRTGVKVSELCLGCMMFGGRTGEEDTAKIIDRAIDAGINFLDTANIYSRGISEEFVGKALAKNGKRDRVILATKVHGHMWDNDPNAWGNNRRHIISQCEASLKRLQTDHIDLYQIHRPNSDTPLDETLRALDDLIRAGKVRYIGTSTFAAWQLMESLMIAREIGSHRFICEQPPYHLLDRRIERELVPFAQTHGFALIPWSPIAQGFFTGKYRRGQEFPAETRFAGGTNGREYTEKAFDVLDVVEQMAREKNTGPAQIALAWCKDAPGITSPIIGPRTMGQMEDFLKVTGVKLTEDDRKRLDEVSPKGGVIVPYYEADFGPHKHRQG